MLIVPPKTQSITKLPCAGVMLKEGVMLTVDKLVSVTTALFVLVPVTYIVYVVVTEGDTTNEPLVFESGPGITE